jgi:predicted RNA-binding Zn ribbon-like protein
METADRFRRVGNKLAIDFANTIVDVSAADGLECWTDLVDFLWAGGAAGATEAGELHREERRNPRKTAAAFRAALALRDAVRNVLKSIEGGYPASAASIERINGALRAGQTYVELEPHGFGWQLVHHPAEPGPMRALGPIARSIADIIMDDEAPQAVRKCAGDDCVLYFYDASRTGQRRWCSMSACGNRAKVAAHLQRTRVDRKAQ